MSNGNEPAFPTSVQRGQNGEYCTEDEGGLTKREYIAARCLQGMVSTANVWPSYNDADEMAKRSVRFADALLAELAK